MSRYDDKDIYRYPSDSLRWPSFRLLRLLPGDDSVHIQCHLYEASPGEEYEALSHVWGSDERVERITVNGQILWITDNLYGALQNLRYAHDERILWIDGICIHQDNNEEKSNQVQNMNKIYAQASQVTVWLGKATPEIALCMNLFAQLQKRVDSYPIEARDQKLAQQLWPDVHTSSHYHLNGLQELLKRPWFSRVWILQEIANARSAVVCTGLYTVDAYIFAAVSSQMKVESPDSQPVLELMPASARDSSLRLQQNLFVCLQKFKASRASNERDMIYALLNLSRNGDDHAAINVDYSRSSASVFQSALRHILASRTASIPQVLDLMSSFSTMETFYIVLVSDDEFDIDDEYDLRTISQAEQSLKHLVSYNIFAKDGLLPENNSEAASMLLVTRHDTDDSSADFQLFAEWTRMFESTSRYLSLSIKTNWSNAPNVRVLVSRASRVLEYAASSGSILTLGWLLKLRPMLSAHAVDLDLQKALFRAVEYGHLSIVRETILAGADPNECAMHSCGIATGGTMLEWAVYVVDQRYGQSRAILESLLECGADPNCCGALYIAAGHGRGDLVRLLLERGANVEQLEPGINSALTLAVYQGHLEEVERMLKAGAQVGEFMLGLAAEGDRATLKLLGSCEPRHYIEGSKRRGVERPGSKCNRCRSERAADTSSPDTSSMKTFPDGSFQSHTSCVSEAQKYQGHLYRDKDNKSNKGEKRKTVNGNSQSMIPRGATKGSLRLSKLFDLLRYSD